MLFRSDGQVRSAGRKEPGFPAVAGSEEAEGETPRAENVRRPSARGQGSYYLQNVGP